jgi:Ca2+-binding RTX toxin-like protein
MVTFTAKRAVNFDKLIGTAEMAASGYTLPGTDGPKDSTHFAGGIKKLTGGPRVELSFTGNGFTYSGGDPVSGLVSAMTVRVRDDFFGGAAEYVDHYVLSGLSLPISASGLALKSIPQFLAGNDLVIGSAGDDVLKGYDGSDHFRGSGGIDSVDGGTGKDFLDFSTEFGSAGVKVTLGSTIKIVDTFGNAETAKSIEVFEGSLLGDQMTGDANANEFHGNFGFDALSGGGGDDQLFGDQGHDTIDGGDGRDTLYGAENDDVVKGGAGPDKIDGGTGKDTLSGDDDDDTIDGGDGDDKLDGGAGFDTLVGKQGVDTLLGGASNDVLAGGIGSDVLIGGPGGDRLYANDINEVIVTDAARDVFLYLSLDDTTAKKKTADAIYGFIAGKGIAADRVDLSPIDAKPGGKDQKFKLVKNFTGAKGEVHLQKAGKDTIIEINADKDAAVDAVIKVVGAKLGEADLIL